MSIPPASHASSWAVVAVTLDASLLRHPRLAQAVEHDGKIFKLTV
jgi:hypothetical protein